MRPAFIQERLLLEEIPYVFNISNQFTIQSTNEQATRGFYTLQTVFAGNKLTQTSDNTQHFDYAYSSSTTFPIKSWIGIPVYNSALINLCHVCE